MHDDCHWQARQWVASRAWQHSAKQSDVHFQLEERLDTHVIQGV